MNFLHPSEALIIYVGLRRFIRHISQAPKFMISALRKVSLALQRKDLFEALKPSIDLLEAERRFVGDSTWAGCILPNDKYPSNQSGRDTSRPYNRLHRMDR